MGFECGGCPACSPDSKVSNVKMGDIPFDKKVSILFKRSVKEVPKSLNKGEKEHLAKNSAIRQLLELRPKNDEERLLKYTAVRILFDVVKLKEKKSPLINPISDSISELFGKIGSKLQKDKIFKSMFDSFEVNFANDAKKQMGFFDSLQYGRYMEVKGLPVRK